MYQTAVGQGEAIKGEKTLQQIAQEFEVHPTQVTQWKKQALDNLGDLFERANKKKEEGDSDAETDKLYKQIGQLSVENEFLKKKYRQWYGHEPKPLPDSCSLEQR